MSRGRKSQTNKYEEENTMRIKNARPKNRDIRCSLMDGQRCGQRRNNIPCTDCDVWVGHMIEEYEYTPQMLGATV
jgi:hypothetical protein